MIGTFAQEQARHDSDQRREACELRSEVAPEMTPEMIEFYLKRAEERERREQAEEPRS